MDTIEDKYRSLARQLNKEELKTGAAKQQLSDKINDNTVGLINSFWNDHNPYVKDSIKQRIISRTLLQITKAPYKSKNMNVWYAAVAVLTIAFGLSLLWNIYNMGASSEMMQYTTAYGEVKDVLLPDGTAVKLNSGSTLVIQKDFEGEKRQVILLGEAYFNVSHNENQPFEISTSHLKLSVLGTEFNLKAYPEDAEIKTVLDEGKVRLDGDFNQAKPVFLNPGQEAILNKNSGRIDVHNLENGQVGKWNDGQIILYNSSLSEVAVMLERKFAVKVIILDDEVKNYRFSGDFSNARLFELLGYLSAARSFNFKAKGDYIIITK